MTELKLIEHFPWTKGPISNYAEQFSDEQWLTLDKVLASHAREVTLGVLDIMQILENIKDFLKDPENSGLLESGEHTFEELVHGITADRLENSRPISDAFEYLTSLGFTDSLTAFIKEWPFEGTLEHLTELNNIFKHVPAENRREVLEKYWGLSSYCYEHFFGGRKEPREVADYISLLSYDQFYNILTTRPNSCIKFFAAAQENRDAYVNDFNEMKAAVLPLTHLFISAFEVTDNENQNIASASVT